MSKFALPDLKLRKRDDGWWVIGQPHWDPKEGVEGPYDTKKEAQSAVSRLDKYYRKHPEACDPMFRHEWRNENLVPVINIRAFCGPSCVPKEWLSKTVAWLAEHNVKGFPEWVTKKFKKKIVIIVPAPKKKTVIVVPKRRRRKKTLSLGIF